MSEKNYVSRRAADGLSRSNAGGESNPRKSTVSNSHLPGVFITGVTALLTLIFCILLARSQMLPTMVFVLICLIFVLLLGLICLLVIDVRQRKRFIPGTILAILMSLILIYANYNLYLTISTLKSVTNTYTEITHIGVYVLTEDEAETLDDLSESTFGVMIELDRTNVDKAIAELEDSLCTELAVAEFDGLTGVVDGLFAGECRAIVINSAYLDIIEELDGYEDLMDRIRELHTLELVEIIVVEDNTDTDSSGNVTTTYASVDGVFSVYISGIDSRNGLVAKSRSDVNILAVVNTNTRQVLLISTPRDYYVPLSISNGKKDKLTHAGIYGIQVSMDTISMLYDTAVDYYFKVDFTGFENIVDALGGISVYSEYAFTSTHGSYSFVKGYNTMNGAQALGFVRERKAFSSGDIQRGKNQLAVIKAVINKIISPEILVNYSALMSSLSGSFETSISYDLLASLVSDQISDTSSWNIVSYSVSGTGDSQIPYSMSTYAYVMVPDESTVQTAKDLIAQVYAGETITSP